MSRWDVVVVGAGPAGSAAALGALHADPTVSVLVLDRADFPRDKACGDGVAPHVLDLLAAVDVHALLDDRVPVRRLALRHGDLSVDRQLARPTYVVPRTVLDDRLLACAIAAGASFHRQRVRAVRPAPDLVDVDGLGASVVVAADGAHSVVRRALGLGAGRTALALRGYAPVQRWAAGSQQIVFGQARQPSYAWPSTRATDRRTSATASCCGPGSRLRPGRCWRSGWARCFPARPTAGRTGGPTTCRWRRGPGGSPTVAPCSQGTRRGWSTR